MSQTIDKLQDSLPEDAFEQFLAVCQVGKGKPDKYRLAFDLLCGIAEGANDYKVLEKNKLPQASYEDTNTVEEAMKVFLARPDVNFLHMLRIMVMQWEIRLMGTGKETYISIWVNADDYIRHFEKTHNLPISLTDLAEGFKTLGIDENYVGWARLEEDQHFASEPDLTWPYFAEHLEVLEQALGVKPYTYHILPWYRAGVKKRALEMLSMFPEPPAELIPALWEMAFGSSKNDRAVATKLLSSLPEATDRATEALASKKKDARLSAATWLAELNAKDAVPAIQAALEKETQEPVKVAMLSALDKLGGQTQATSGAADTSDASSLLAEAQAGLKKGVPKGLAWFNFEALPAVHWETGEEVPKDVITWWTVQQVTVGNPDPNPQLISRCSMLKQEDREALGEYIVGSWIARNLESTYTVEVASQIAEKDVKQYAKWYRELYPGKTHEELVQKKTQEYLDQYTQSAIKEKGMLAVAAACGGTGMTPMIDKFIKQHSHRAPHCKALIHVLPWIDDKSATQLLLGIAARHKTKGIREEADACAKTLAERKGWTVDELADRTIPSAGFDEKGELLLEYGPRNFTARINSRFDITLYDENGQMIKSLPDARKDDDAEKAKESKEILSDAKKQIKTVLAVQKDRLYSAMCMQRIWNCEDWSAYLLTHPIIGHYCQSIIWKASDNGKDLWFRPLDDGTFSDHQDGEVKVPEKAIISIAHSLDTPEDQRNLWLAHLKDYEITPLFDQFARPLYTLPENLREEKELQEIKGRQVRAGDIMKRANKLGYTRVTSGEFGLYMFFGKTFAGAGVQAVIEFKESALDDPNEMLTLHDLHFERTQKSSVPWSRHQFVPLGEIPSVLMSECWNDMRECVGDQAE